MATFEGIIMAATTADRPGEKVGYVLSCSPAWRDWARKLAERERSPLSAVIDHQLAKRAEELGHDAPPKR